MIRMQRPGGGVFWAAEDRVKEYLEAGCYVAPDAKGPPRAAAPADTPEDVSGMDTEYELPRRRRKRRELKNYES